MAKKLSLKISFLLLLLTGLLFSLPSQARDDEPIKEKKINKEVNSASKDKKNKDKTSEKYSGKDSGELIFWEVKSKSTTIHLLGSIHLLKKNIFPLDDKIIDAYDDASYLVVEVNIDPNDIMGAMQMQQKMMQIATYKNGKTLDDVLSPEEITKLKKFLPSLFPYQMAKTFKPWMTGQMITALKVMEQGADANKGIDMHFLNQARQSKKQILSLETIDEQVEALSGGDDNEQKELLLDTLENANEISKALDNITEMWLTGDVAAIQKSMIDDAIKEKKYMKKYLKRMNTDRNIKMADKIAAYLKNDKKYFVIAGTLHMIGEQGLPHLLKEKGFEVTRIKKTKKAANKKEGIGASK